MCIQRTFTRSVDRCYRQDTSAGIDMIMCAIILIVGGIHSQCGNLSFFKTVSVQLQFNLNGLFYHSPHVFGVSTASLLEDVMDRIMIIVVLNLLIGEGIHHVIRSRYHIVVSRRIYLPASALIASYRCCSGYQGLDTCCSVFCRNAILQQCYIT